MLSNFSDASQDTYGAIVYYKSVFPGVLLSSVIVAAKARVAPLSALGVPRLGLMSAILGFCRDFKGTEEIWCSVLVRYCRCTVVVALC